MKRTLLAMMASSMLVFAVPAVASAAHGKHHHGARHGNAHKRHGKSARLVTFAPVTAPASGAPTTPTTPANETAGTVTSFANGVLTITLTDGTVVSGKVTEQTKLQCTSATPSTTTGDDDQGGGDDQNGRESGEHGGPSPMGMEHRDFHGNDGLNGNQSGNDESCTTAALVSPTKVREAELSLSSAGAVWEKVDLVK
jgi:hypothetical protein